MTRIRPGTIVLFAALLLIGACSGDSPTAPPPGSGGGAGEGGGTPPPAEAEITLAVSNDNPLVNSTSTITATVTENGEVVPDGTAVEFQTTFGAFVVGQTTDNILIKTTENGIATVTLTATSPGEAVVTARVNTVFEKTTIVFKQQATDPTPPGEPQPTIASIAPESGPPEGGTVVTLSGQNFEGPVRVLFGDKEAVIASQTSNEVRAISPKVNFEVGEETREVPVTVIFEAGTTGETSVQAPSPFRYEIEALTPQVVGVSPSSGPNEGGTLLAIFGSGFQAPVRVYFGSAANEVEADVQQVSFNEITVLTPKASGLG
ncbi:MAG: IPT/TIG domain-containing protein, partial [Thermoanaerobaculia bacterium]|nr:IPT/TIG domain-containing protein [Thermoanaerobaculia bacterium]